MRRHSAFFPLKRLNLLKASLLPSRLFHTQLIGANQQLDNQLLREANWNCEDFFFLFSLIVYAETTIKVLKKEDGKEKFDEDPLCSRGWKGCQKHKPYKNLGCFERKYQLTMSKQDWNSFPAHKACTHSTETGKIFKAHSIWNFHFQRPAADRAWRCFQNWYVQKIYESCKATTQKVLSQSWR